MDGALEEYAERTARAGPRAGTGASVPQAGFTVLVPTRALPRFTPAEFLKTLNRAIGSAGAAAALVPELTRFEQSPGGARIWHRPQMPPRIGASVAGITLLVEGEDRPALGAEEIGALSFRSWPAGAREIARTRAHLRISEPHAAPGADLDTNHDRAAALTLAAAAALELAQGLGVVWQNSGVAVAAGEMLGAVPGLAAGDPPLALWVDAAAQPCGAVATRGLYPLLGAEVELRAPSLARAAAERVVMEMAADILDTGRVPAEGTVVERGLRVALHVRYREAGDGGVPAIMLEETRPGIGHRAGSDRAASVA